MPKILIKILSGFLILLLLAIIAYVVLNATYFSKQFEFKFNPPVPAPPVNQNNIKGDPNQVEIPSLGIKAPIVEPISNKETDFQEALKTGVVHFPGSAKVGEEGNMYIFGHSSDFAFKAGSYKTVFALLPNIKNNAEIIVTNNEGTKFTYIVTGQKIVRSNDTSVLDQNTHGKKILTLQTSYPIGTALKRYIVIAEFKE